MSDSIPLGHLQIAFLFDALTSVLEAGDPDDRDALAYLQRCVPPPLMAAAGLLDSSGTRTSARYADAMEQGRERLAFELEDNGGAGLCRKLWTLAGLGGDVRSEQVATIWSYGRVVGVDPALNDAIGLDVLMEISKAGRDITLPDDWAPAGEESGQGIVPDGTITLPPVGTAHAWLGRLDELVGGEAGWGGLQAGIAAALRRLSPDGSRTVVAYAARIDGLDRSNRPAELVAVLLGFSGQRPSAESLIGVREALQACAGPVVDEGLQPVPDSAFPTLALVGGDLYQLWIPDASGPVALSLEYDPEECSGMTLGVELQDADVDDFLSDIRHAVVE